MRALIFVPFLTLVLVGCDRLLPNRIERLVGLNTTALGYDKTGQKLSGCLECPRLKDLFIADLHADSFLWGFDVRKSRRSGHVDLERLRAGGVDLQVFSVPSSTPLGRGAFDGGPVENDDRYFDGNADQRNIGELKCTTPGKDRDTSKLLFAATLRQFSFPRQIAYQQAAAFCRATEGRWDPSDNSCGYAPSVTPNANHFFAVRTRDDLNSLLTAIEATGPGQKQPVGAMLGIEGVHWIDADATEEQVVGEIRALKRAGFRMIGLTHKFSNGLGGSDEDCRRPDGLTPAGVKAVRAVFDENLILDLAHLGKDGVWLENGTRATALSIAAEPQYDNRRRMVMSHGAIQSRACGNYRNLPATHVRKLMEQGVPFGMIHWDDAYCLKPVGIRGTPAAKAIEDAIISAYRQATQDLGVPVKTAVESLAFGADLDGAVHVPYDVRGFSLLLRRLEQEDWCGTDQACADAVERVAGENVKAFLLQALD